MPQKLFQAVCEKCFYKHIQGHIKEMPARFIEIKFSQIFMGSFDECYERFRFLLIQRNEYYRILPNLISSLVKFRFFP